MKHLFIIIAICLSLSSCGDKEYDDDIINNITTEVYSVRFISLVPDHVAIPDSYEWPPFHKTVWDALPTYLIAEIDTTLMINESPREYEDIILEIKNDATLRIEKTPVKYSKGIVYKKRSYGCPQGEYEFNDIGENKVNFTITVKSDGAYIDNFGGYDVWNLIPLPRIELEKTDKIVEQSEEGPKVIVFEQTRPYTPTQPMTFANDEYEFVITMNEQTKVREVRPIQSTFTLDKVK